MTEETSRALQSQALMMLPERAQNIVVKRGLDPDAVLYMALQLIQGHGLLEELASLIHETTGG